MKDEKLKQLFAAARRETPPAVPADFAEQIGRALPRRPTQPASVSVSLWDQLDLGFGRCALAAAALIVLCATVEISQHFNHEPSLDDDVQQICDDWMSR